MSTLRSVEPKELLDLLKRYEGNKNAQATFLQTYIQNFGPVPNQYAAEIRKLME